MTPLPNNDDHALCAALADIAAAAGAEIMRIYDAGFETRRKDDASPVTDADREGERIILERLTALAPETPVLAEEAASEGAIPALGDEFFLVDPLDGTKEFINRSGEFTVNIALVRAGAPALGVVLAPALGRLYAGVCGAGAWRAEIDRSGAQTGRQAISVAAPPPEGLVAVASRSHRSPETDAFLATLSVADFAAAGSSLKFCLLADGAAHIYPRFGRTMEWDTGAGQAVLVAAGGKVLTHPDGAPLTYNKQARGFDNPHFIAYGG